MEQIQDLLSKLQDLVDERDQKQDWIDEANAAGHASQVEGYVEDLADLNAEIDAIKANIERQIRSL
jgi:peptidoglycan hydrolase CwlO-like protein